MSNHSYISGCIFLKIHMNTCSYIVVYFIERKKCMEDNKRKKIKTDDIEVCQTHCVHLDAVDSVRKETPSEEMLDDLAELFKVFGDGTRIKIIYSLFEKELCVCDIAELLGMTQSAISHQLRVLKNNRLVKFRKSGKTVYYSLDDEHIRRIFDCGLCHVKEMYY